MQNIFYGLKLTKKQLKWSNFAFSCCHESFWSIFKNIFNYKLPAMTDKKQLINE